jgi:hypothetical protein
MSAFLFSRKSAARLVALLVALPIGLSVSASAQAPAKDDPVRVPANGEPLHIRRIVDIPRHLRAAIDRAECPLLASILATTPAVIFQPSPAHRLMAIVPCNALITYSLVFLFDRTAEAEPRLVMLPVMAPSGGFSATDSPGLITWDPATKTLTAVAENDYCNVRETRHTYRHGQGGLNGFALVKLEHRMQLCDSEAPWQKVWEAQPWPNLD